MRQRIEPFTVAGWTIEQRGGNWYRRDATSSHEYRSLDAAVSSAQSLPHPSLRQESHIGVITGQALAVLLNGIEETEMVYLRVRNQANVPVSGKLLGVHAQHGVFALEMLNGRTVQGLRVERVTSVDVRPYVRYPL